MGDPAGVGPELCLRALADPRVRALCAPVLYGDIGVLQRVAEQCGLPLPEATAGLADPAPPGGDGPVTIDCAAIDAATVAPGRVQAACGRAAFVYVSEGIRAAMLGRTCALVTAPIHKEALHAAGVPFPGHTELLAARTHTTDYCMMLGSDAITVSLVTTHVAYADVPSRVTRDRILRVIALTDAAMRRRGRVAPRLTVCGLNPHAGEHGLFGDEEETVIAPAVAEARTRGFRVEGPLPPDTAFVPARRARTDAYIVMYHDQGLIPFKMLAFDEGVNVTLGLPIVRTSVDHGTAFDIAWQGKASPNSLFHAIRWAVELAAASPPRTTPVRPDGAAA